MSNAEVVEFGSAAMSLPVRVAELSLQPFRSGGLCSEQIARLVESHGDWPPILVRRNGLVVIDGAHRVAAARRLGLSRIDAHFFDGDAEAGFVEFVRRNVSQGLSLTLEERRRAAERVLRAHPHWSDRRIAELCVLSPKTIARVRACEELGAEGEAPRCHGAMREGRDRRLRPVVSGSARERALAAISERPDASLRELASEASVSPETVRQARLAIAAVATSSEWVPGDPDDRADHPTGPFDGSVWWAGDTALAASESGESFVAWFGRTCVDERDLSWIERVPLSRVYAIADEARRRSEIWLTLARALDALPATARSGKKWQ